MVLTDGQDENIIWEEAQKNIQSELEETEKALHEVTLMLEQSQVEVGKLSQRNASITAYLQQVQSQINSMPVNEIRMAYESALDAQQRLFVMRGQLEKLQSDQSHFERYVSSLHQMNELLAHGTPSKTKIKNSAAASVEMIVNAQESERQRLSRLMHDGPAQALSNFILQTEIAMRLLDVNPEQARDELNSLKGAAMATFQKVRNFIFELRPMMLDDLGLIPTIKRFTDSYKEQTGIDVNLVVSGSEKRLESYQEVMIFRAIQELLGNTARHSHANSVKVFIDQSEDIVKVSVEDSGKGFDPDNLTKTNSLGLKLIRERVELLGGNFELDSVPGKGTRIMFAIPARV